MIVDPYGIAAMGLFVAVKLWGVTRDRRRIHVTALEGSGLEMSDAEVDSLVMGMREALWGARPYRRKYLVRQFFEGRGYRAKVWTTRQGRDINVQVIERLPGAHFQHVPEWTKPDQPAWWREPV